MPEISAQDGAYLVGLARRAIEHYFESGKSLLPQKRDGVLGEKRGVFVTLESYPQKELRGCIGYPLPIKELALAVVDNALHAAFEDPRFPPLDKRELKQVVIEVSVLTVPERIEAKDPSEYPKKIKVGRDGLIIEYGYSSGLLLPQVPVEWNWNEEEFLCQVCQKAGLPPSMWRSPSAKISRFEAAIFAEKEPGGRVERKKLVR
ncbi:MAG: TIGR00296 family protein [Candidatus Micrarchaeota archaeon]|nr:TIGR00296 family protein [Candidatus Micrarchaeota archaeon]